MRVFSPLLTLLTIIIVVPTPSPAVPPDRRPSASGSGEFSFFTGIQTKRFDFSFDASANKTDRANGRAQFDNLTDETHVVVRINCLNIDSGVAIMTGNVLHSDDPNLPKLTHVIFAATDFELFPFFGGDTITPLFAVPADFDCHAGEPLTILPVEDGGIEIHP